MRNHSQQGICPQTHMKSCPGCLWKSFLVGIEAEPLPKETRQFQDLLQKSKSHFLKTLHSKAHYYLKKNPAERHL